MSEFQSNHPDLSVNTFFEARDLSLLTLTERDDLHSITLTRPKKPVYIPYEISALYCIGVIS